MPLDIDRYAHLDSPIQRWDPRLKIASLGLFVLAVSLLQTLPLAALGLALGLLWLRAAALPWGFVAQGVRWVLLFLLPFFLILPVSYPGEPDLHLLGLPFAWEGLRLAVLITLKALAIVLTAYAMFGTSRFDLSMQALERLGAPKVLVQMILFTYRYVFVFLAEMRRKDTAMRARGFVKRADRRTMQVMGHFVGTLLVRSFERTERIYKAMLSKGYTGELRTLVRFRADGGDWAKAAAVLALAALLLGADLAGPFHAAEQGWF